MLSVQMITDHPRLRGDHSGKQQDYGEALGSPPLAQGPLGLGCDQPVGDGITPAYAGTTPCRRTRGRSTRDHPRLRGDHALYGTHKGWRLGSPPLTRGPLDDLMHRLLIHRITPAYAGTTARPCPSRPGTRDHPRLRGDHDNSSVAFRRSLGSPPLTRGPHGRPYIPRPLMRITPAYAGTTDILFPSGRDRKDHPRLRGDHAKYGKGPTAKSGSPPLTRGPRNLTCPNVDIERITPAYAGTTTACEMWLLRRPDHPRLRGDHSLF